MTYLDAHRRDDAGRLWAPVIETADLIAESIEQAYMGWETETHPSDVVRDIRSWGQLYGR